MSRADHIIQRHVFDISYPVREKAYELQSKFSRLFDRQAIPVMTEVFDQLIPENLILRLDAMTLDLGPIRHDRLEKDFPDRLRQVLQKELQRMIQQQAPGEWQGRAKTLTELLEYFLLTGSLPWWAAGSLLTDPMAVADQLISEDPQGMRRVLSAVGHRKEVRLRLIHQYPETAIRRMVQVLEPQEASFIFVYHEDIIRLRSTGPFFRQDIGEFRRTLWLFIFTYLLVDRGSNFNRRIFVKSTLVQMAREYNMEYVSLITLLMTALDAVPLALLPRSALPGIIHILFEEEERMPVAEPPQSPAELAAGELARIRAWLLQDYLPGQPSVDDAPSLSALFTQLIRQVPDAIQQLMQSLNGKEGIWARIVGSFDEGAVKSLVRLREPEEAEFIFHYAGRLAELQRQQFPVPADSGSFNRSVWEVILAYLWTQRGSLFNTRRFLEYNIRRISRRHHLSYRQLLAFLVQGIGEEIGSDRDSTLFHSLMLLLEESAEAVAPASSPDSLSSPASPLSPLSFASVSIAGWLSALDHYQLYRRWPDQWRMDGQGTDEIMLQQILQWLFRESPLELMKLLGEGSLGAHPAANDAARTIIQQTIRILFSSTAQAHYRVQHILHVAGAEPLRLLMKYIGGEALPALKEVFQAAPQHAHPEPAASQPHLQPAASHPHLQGADPQLASAAPPQPAPQHPHPQPAASHPHPPHPAPDAPDPGPSPDAYYIANAGLILLHPLLPHFLQRLGLTTQQHQFVDRAARHRSAHLLQYLVTGHLQDSPRLQDPPHPEGSGRLQDPPHPEGAPGPRLTHPEHQLVLNKLLCEIPLHEPIPLEIVMTREEQQLAAQLFQTLLQQWTKLGNTSVEGVQVSFLQREGSLTRVQDGWRLRVQQRGIDVLLPFLPWAYGILRLPWMQTTIYTEWT